MESFDWNAFYWGLLFLMLAIGFIAFAQTYNRDLHKKSGIRYKGKCPCCGLPEPTTARKQMKKEGGYRCVKCDTWVIPNMARRAQLIEAVAHPGARAVVEWSDGHECPLKSSLQWDICHYRVENGGLTCMIFGLPEDCPFRMKVEQPTKHSDVCHRIKMFLAHVNAVTAPHIHGNPVPARRLDDLNNKQIEMEEWLEGFSHTPIGKG